MNQAQMIFIDNEAEKIENYKKLTEILIGDHKVDFVKISTFEKPPTKSKLLELLNCEISVFIIDLDLGTDLNDGITFIKKIRNEATLIIVYSGNVDSDEVRNNCYEAGADVIFDKGGSAKEVLLTCLRLLIKQYNKKLGEKIESNVFLTEVIDFNDEKVLLAVKKEGIEGEVETWFDRKRLSNISNLKFGNSLYMIDSIYKNNTSMLHFIETKDNLFNHNNELNELITKYENEPNLFTDD